MLTSIQEQNAEWYMKLMTSMKKDDLDSIQEIFTLCDQRLAARESKNIEKQGGWFASYNSFVFFKFTIAALIIY